MDLNTLANNLRAQAAASSTIVLDGTVFPSPVLDEIRTAFALAAGANLTVTGISSSDIPDPVNGTLTITTGTASVLNQSGVGIGLTFTAPGSVLVAVITATMSTSWKFSDSFEGLNTFPFQDLETSGVFFAYATVRQAAYPWPGDASFTVALEPGLNFLSNVTLNNFSVLSTLLGALVGSSPFKFYGAFSPTAGESLPVGAIRAPLGAGTFSIGVTPNALALANPAVAVRIGTSNAEEPVQNIDLLVEAELNDTLKVAVGIPQSGGTLSVSTAPLPNQGSINRLIESLPGGSGFTNFIPSELSSIFANVGLDNFAMVVTSAPKVTYLSLSISTLQPWTVISDVLVLEGLGLQIEVVDPTGLSWTRVFIEAKAGFLPNIFTGELDFTIGLEKQASWEVSTVSGAYYGSVNLGDIVGGLLGNPSSVPEALRAIEFSNFGVNATRSAPGSPFTYSFYGNVAVAFPILGSELTAQLNLAVTKTPTGHTILLTGALAIGDQAFSLTLDLGAAGSKLSATWTNSGEPLGFGDIASAFGWDSMPTIPTDLDLALTSASFTYDFTAGSLALGAESKNYGKAAFATLNVNQTRQYFFLLDADQTFNLSNLPLVGEELAKIETITVSDLKVIISSLTPIDATTASAVNALIQLLGAGYPTLPTAGTAGKFIASASIQFGDETLPLSVSLGGVSGSSGSGSSAAALLPSAVTSSGSPDGVTWFNVQRSFGPVSIGRIGVMYQSDQQALWFELDATLAFGPLSLSLVGLGIGSPLTSFKPQFSLQGLGVSYVKPPLEIAGALVNLAPPGASFIEFEGGVIVSTSKLTLEAFGYYGNQQGFSSMFIFGDLAYPFGGPPAFFLTGVALGFGYNSNLRLPTIDEVQSFPFVQVLPTSTSPNTGLFGPNPTPINVLDVIMNTAPPWVGATAGSLWFGAGITFTSFELVNAQAMLFVEVGDRLVIALIGDARAQFPQQAGGSFPVYANIELDLAVRFAPTEGVFSAQAVLASSSFLLDPACVLTGGFAFFVWYGNSPYAGDFVLTLGGYNPGFKPPSYYPAVPVVGFHWAMDSSITISGGAYLALTPAVMMVGGRLDATYQSGNLKAWFDAHADVIVRWKPFWFDADIGITIGASYKIDLLFTSATVSVELGCDLELWGPPTGGRVTVDWYIISFTIGFGTPKQSGQTIQGWADVEAMLPNSSATSTRNVLAVTPAAGLTSAGTSPGTSAPWLVRGSQFAFTASTPIPATSATVGGTYAFRGSTFNVYPLGWVGVSSALTVAITDAESRDVSRAFEVALLRKGVPASLWGSPPQSGGQQQVPSGSNQVVPNQITGVFVEVNPPQTGASAGAVDVESALAFVDLELPHAELPLSATAQPTGDVPGNSGTTISVIANPTTGIASAKATAARNAIFAGLATLSYAPDTANDPMSVFADAVGCAFADEPLLVS